MPAKPSTSPSPSIEELLAAYADGALEPEETRRVDAYLEDNTDAVEQVATLRQVINDARAAQPRPQQEPEWHDMAQTIRAACTPVAPSDSWWRRLLRPRIAFPSILAAAAAVVLFASWPRNTGHSDADPVTQIRSSSRQLADNPSDNRDTASDSAPPTLDDDTGVPRVAELAALGESELDSLELALRATDDLEAESELEQRVDNPARSTDPILSTDAIAGWDGDVEVAGYTYPAYEENNEDSDLFGELDTDWLDELDEDDIDALDAFLASQTG